MKQKYLYIPKLHTHKNKNCGTSFHNRQTDILYIHFFPFMKCNLNFSCQELCQ